MVQETREARAKAEEIAAARDAVPIWVTTVAQDVYMGNTGTDRLTLELKAAAVNGWDLTNMTTVYAEKLGVNKVIHTLVFKRGEEHGTAVS